MILIAFRSYHHICMLKLIPTYVVPVYNLLAFLIPPPVLLRLKFLGLFRREKIIGLY